MAQTTDNQAQAKTEVKCEYTAMGCQNCLWSCVECVEGSLYEPKLRAYSGEVIESCAKYAYFD